MDNNNNNNNNSVSENQKEKEKIIKDKLEKQGVEVTVDKKKIIRG